MDLGLAGRACAVTGASRGIGRETARMLCRRGRLGAAGRARRGATLAEARRECARRRRAVGGSLALDVTAADAGERIVAACEAALRQARRARQQRRHGALARPRRRPRGGLVRGLGAERDGAAARDARRGARRWPSAAGAGSSTSRSTAGKRPSAQMPEYSVAKAAELSLSRLFADRYAADGVLVNAICPGPTKSELWMDEGGLLDQSQEHGRARRPARRRSRPPGRKRPIGRLAESRGDRRGDRLPLLRARLLRRRRGVVGRRRHRPGDHLSDRVRVPVRTATADSASPTVAASRSPS